MPRDKQEEERRRKAYLNPNQERAACSHHPLLPNGLWLLARSLPSLALTTPHRPLCTLSGIGLEFPTSFPSSLPKLKSLWCTRKAKARVTTTRDSHAKDVEAVPDHDAARLRLRPVGENHKSLSEVPLQVSIPQSRGPAITLAFFRGNGRTVLSNSGAEVGRAEGTCA